MNIYIRLNQLKKINERSEGSGSVTGNFLEAQTELFFGFNRGVC
jgi:hypothetical protein